MDISIIIATHNRSHLLRRTLESFEKLDTDGIEWELLIVDNASADNGETVSILKEYESKLPLTILSEPTPGKNRALNKAVPLAKGELFVFTDNDVIADPMWIKNLWEASKRWPEVDIFGGKIEPLFPEDAPDFVRNLKTKHCQILYAQFAPLTDEGSTTVLPFGANLAIKYSVFQSYSYNVSVGPTNKTYQMGSETELLERLQKAEKTIVYVPSALVQHIIEKFQLKTQWQYQRMYRFGWGKSRYQQHSSPRTFRKVPLYLWRKLFLAWLRYCTCFRFQEKWEYAMQYYYQKGIVKGELEKVRNK